MTMRPVFVLLAALLFSPAANAQGAFDPPVMAYVLCVTDETKKLALEMPPRDKAQVIENALSACGDLEAQSRKSLSDHGLGLAAIEQRLAQLKKFLRQTAQDDIDRFRVNRTPN
jgi:hypothetical protein